MVGEGEEKKEFFRWEWLLGDKRKRPKTPGIPKAS